ncbi:MAG: hypothetical protein QN178_13195 [Armatimonadota bacterium]|nr:hypothetical protein [Armatimonadota bacterium]
MDILPEIFQRVISSALVAGWLLLLAGLAGFTAVWLLSLWTARS